MVQPRKLDRIKPYSEIIELTPWDFCDDSLLPYSIIKHSCNVHQRHFGSYYWNLFNRVEDQRVTYEIPLFNLEIMDKQVDFLDQRRLLFETNSSTVHDKSMLQIQVNVFKSVSPFEKVAVCNFIGAECLHNDPDNWIFGEFTEPPQVTSKLSELLPESDRLIVENTVARLNQIDRICTFA